MTIRPVQSYFSDVISNLEVEEVRSEFQRTNLLIILFGLILLIAIANFFVLRDSLMLFYGDWTVFFTLLAFIAAFLLYQILVLQYLKKKLRLVSGTPTAYKFIQTMIEISFPTIIMFYMMDQRKMISFLDSPLSLMYFLFITLSILHLDFKVNIFAGLLAAIQYVSLVYYGFHKMLPDQIIQSTMPETPYYVRSLVFMFSGAAAAFVSAELKNRIRSTFDFQTKKNELELLFGQQVSREVSRELMMDKGATKRREATVMFLDIRDFTRFADSHTADEVIEYQNRILGPLIDIINQHQGVVFQILGDGLMACFGSPGENVLHADMAFQASIQILKHVNEASEKQLIPNTRIGVGLHSGLMVTGNIGNESRKQFSVSGTPVIVASRIEQLNKKYGSQLLMSGQVYEQVATGKMEITYLGEELLKGIETPVRVYKVI